MSEETTTTIPAYAPIIVKLFQSVIYDEDRRVWQELLSFQHQIRSYFATIGIELHLNEQDGFAYLSQPDEMEGSKVPRLMRRMPLTYEVTLLLVILREAIEEFDVQNTDNRKLFITNVELKERIELFFADKADKVKLLDRFDTYINSVVNLGFLKEAQVRAHDEKTKTYEVMRIVKAKINNEKLEEIRAKLKGEK
ncbi:MAG: DUF4194 domain-containing protein [Saprospiraceae bacterium]